jgi:RNA polymerase sigma-70 factor (ECF subfamily)
VDPNLVLDSDLVAAYRERDDQQAFTELVRRYREPVFRLALSILGPGFAGEAEEVAQEVFLRVHHSLESFRGDAQFSSWIYRIAFNQAINLKERVRYRAPHLSEQMLAAKASPATDPLSQLESARSNRALIECVDELPEIYQSALRLHYWMGMGVAEIASLIGVPENTVKSYLHRARQRLHEMLKERGIRDV